MEVVILLSILLIFAVSNIVCLIIGTKLGQTVAKGEPVELPSVNPLKVIREREERREAKAEAERVETIMQNIEGYDGTSRGQKDVPGMR